MANKKTNSKSKSKKNQGKKAAGSISLIAIVLIILVIGFYVAPSVPALEGKVYNVELNVSKTELTCLQGDNVNLTYDAAYKYIGINAKDLSSDVTIEYQDSEGNKIERIDTSVLGTYKAIYTVKYKSVTKQVAVNVKVVDKSSSAKVEFHFIDPTSAYAYAGDSVYIKAGDTDILIDAGPRPGSAAIIEEYIDQYCTDKVLEYVIATHADQDHIAAFVGTKTAPSILDYYTCEVFIDFPLSDKTSTLYKNYLAKVEEAVGKGMKHYSALECWNGENGAQKTYEIATGITMNILYNYYYENKSSDENNYSVCVLFSDTTTNKHFLFTGDLEIDGEEHLVQDNNLPEVEFFKAGHHGSPTSSNEVLLEVIKPKATVFTGVAGYGEYTKDIDRIFPSTMAIDRLAKYTDKMYCLGALRDGNYEPLNGTVIVKYENGEVTIHGLNNDTILKDSWWFNSDVDYYKKNTKTYGLCDYLTDSENPKEGTRKWRTWPE